MISFKKFLNEAAIGSSPTYTEHALEEAKAILHTHCRDGLWMLHHNMPLYRGSKSTANWTGDFHVADPSATERKSQNTSNFYTVLMDNLPSWQGYPKRSKSFICTTSKLIANKYAKGHGARIVIPFDGVKIAVCPKPDLWDVQTFQPRVEFSGFKIFFEELGLKGKDTFADIAALETKMKTDDIMSSRIITAFSEAALRGEKPTQEVVDEIRSGFMEYLDEYVNPELLDFELYTSKSLQESRKSMIMQETWFSGKCIFISESAWQRLRASLKE